MPTGYYASVTCPVCGTKFQVAVQQILDVRVDPTVTQRVLSGAVNVAICPACGTAGPLNLPFIYHDPAREAALLYLPAEVGRTEVERQRVAGRLTQQLMNALPPEERKGYLLQPETFISMESLIKRVLELEGVTEEELERSRRQRELLDELVRGDEERWGKVVQENDDLIDDNFLAFLRYIVQTAEAAQAPQAEQEKLRRLYSYLLEQTTWGRKAVLRSRAVSPYFEHPTRETLLQALMDAPDDETFAALVQSGLAMMDYWFFHILTERIAQTADAQEKEQLLALRQRILDAREAVEKRMQEAYVQRLALIGQLAHSRDMEKAVRSHLSEIDDLFLIVLDSEIEHTADPAIAELRQIIQKVLDEHAPPHIRLFNQLLGAQSEEEIEALLDQHRQLVTPDLLGEMVEALNALIESGQKGEAAAQIPRERLERLLSVLRRRMVSATSDTGTPSPAASPSSPEERTPSGLIIARR